MHARNSAFLSKSVADGEKAGYSSRSTFRNAGAAAREYAIIQAGVNSKLKPPVSGNDTNNCKSTLSD